MVEHAIIRQALCQEIPSAWQQEGDLACILEKVVPGSPWPTGGNDDGLLCLILPDLDQSPLQKRNGGIGIEGQGTGGFC